MEIIWSSHALRQAEQIGDYIAKDSPARACTFIDKLISSVERLKKFPYSGLLVKENPAFRQIVFERYRIIYRIAEDSVEIVTIYSPGLNR
jgi:toxin ParE1/3/4